MPISNTTAKDFENLISYLNSCWNVLSDWYGQFFLYLHSFTPKNGFKVGQYKGPKSPQNRVFGLLRKIVSLVFARNDLKWSILWLANFLYKSPIWENSRPRDLEQKWPKKGKNRVFGIFGKIESLVFARNDLKWGVLRLTNFLRKCHIWENSHSQDLCVKALVQSDCSIFQITISFEPFNSFYIFLHIDIIL